MEMDVCFICYPEWTKWYFAGGDKVDMKPECLIKDPLMITVHLGPWILKNYHFACAIKSGIISREEAIQMAKAHDLKKTSDFVKMHKL